MTVPGSSSRPAPWSLLLVIAVAAAVVVGYFAVVGVGVHSNASAPSGPTNSGATPAVFSHAATVNHAGKANRGVNGSYGPATALSHTWAISSGPDTTTPALNVQAESRVFVFVGYLDVEGGGGSVSDVTDSLGDGYSLVLSSFIPSNGVTANYSEDLYESSSIPSNTSLSVSVNFYGAATMGGTVAAVDVLTQIGTPTVDVVYSQRGTGGTASVITTTTMSLDLLLLGVSGPEAAAPFTAGPGETLLDTAGGTTGPGADGDGFGTFSASENGMVNNLTANLATPGAWAAIGVGIYGFNESGTPGSTTTPSFGVATGSVIFLFVGYVNPAIGGGEVGNISDTLGDTFTLVVTIGAPQNHSEDLYVSSAIRTSGSTSVTVSFVGGDTPMGGSVAAVDVVASSGLPVVDQTGTQTGSWTPTASVSVATPDAREIVLLGVSGMGRAAPFTATAGETLLDTGTNTSGPFLDGTGFGTFLAPPTGSVTSLSATLNTPAEWEAIGVGISSTGGSPPSDGGSLSGPSAGLGSTWLVSASAPRSI